MKNILNTKIISKKYYSHTVYTYLEQDYPLLNHFPIYSSIDIKRLNLLYVKLYL